MRVRIAASWLTLALIAGGVVMSTGPAAVASDAGTPVWAADFMAGGVVPSRARAITQAKHFDVIAALKGTYAPHVAAMRSANPDLVLLVYLNGVMAQSGQGSAYPSSWYLRDAKGNKVQSRGWGNYLMNPSQPGWIDDVSARCESFLAQSGYDGCFLDVLGTAPLHASYVTGLPIDPATGKVWTKRAWLNATTDIADAARGQVGPAPVYGNGLGNGTLYFAHGTSSSEILGGLDGGMAESFVRDAHAPVGSFRSTRQWRRDADLLKDVAAGGDVGLAITKVWSSAPKRQTNRVQRYALATFLLGFQPGMGYFSFRDDHRLTRYRPAWHRPIGVPLGRYTKVGDSYVREFSRGVVVVNPTNTKLLVPLDGRYRRAGGSVSRVTLRPHRGTILVTA